MTREEMAAILGRVKQAADPRISIMRIVVDEHGEMGETIYRGSFVAKNAGPVTEALSETTRIR